jgi:Tfp pilus assembly protein PilV
MEALLASIIMGIGMTAVMAAIGNSTRATVRNARLTQAIYLSQEIREWTLSLPFHDTDSGQINNAPGLDETSLDDIDDLDDLSGTDGTGVSFNSPRDSQGSAITGMADWTETVTLSWRSPADPTTDAPVGSTDLVYVQVSISYKNQQVLQAAWFVGRKD